MGGGASPSSAFLTFAKLPYTAILGYKIKRNKKGLVLLFSHNNLCTDSLNVGKGHKEIGKQRKLSAVVDQSVKAQKGMITQVKYS